MIPLSETRAGQRARVVALAGGMGVRRRMAGLGLTVGCEVRTMISSGRGPLVIAVRQTRLAIGRGMAAHIMVHPISAETAPLGASGIQAGEAQGPQSGQV